MSASQLRSSRRRPLQRIGSVTLARALSKLGVASRSRSPVLIKEGRVTVNGVVKRNPDTWIDLGQDCVAIDNVVAGKKQFVYLALNKPTGYVTTRSDERGRKTVYDLLDAEHQFLFPIGRLDKETSGLLLFTNDTQFGERITNPESKLPKTYELVLDLPLQPVDADLMRKGLLLEDTKLRPAVVIVKKNPILVEMTIGEGKNRQIRRMLETLGYRVVALHRQSIGDVALGDLPDGKTKVLRPSEIEALRSRFGQNGSAYTGKKFASHRVHHR